MITIVTTLTALNLVVTPISTSQSHGVSVPVEDPSGTALDAFHKSLQATRLGQKKTRILHFGASHTAADMFTGQIRSNLQNQFGDGGHGWFMPARPHKYYRHQALVFEGPPEKKLRWHWDFARNKPKCHNDGLYGLAGMSIMADKPTQWARFRTARKGKVGKTAASLEIYYAKQWGGGDLTLTINSKRWRRIKTRGRPRLGVFSMALKPGHQSVYMKPRGNGFVRLYGAVLETHKPGVVIDTMGINGTRARQMLRWNDAQWKALVQRRNPALVALWYGTNESGDTHIPISTYKSNLRAVVQKIKTAAPNASCMLIAPSHHPHVQREDRKDPNPSFRLRHRTFQISAAKREIAREFNCAFWDAIAATGGPFSIINWVDEEPRLAARDYLHFTRRGYKLLADLYTSAILTGYTRRYGN